MHFTLIKFMILKEIEIDIIGVEERTQVVYICGATPGNCKRYFYTDVAVIGNNLLPKKFGIPKDLSSGSKKLLNFFYRKIKTVSP